MDKIASPIRDDVINNKRMTLSYATLPDRAIIKVTGTDAKSFLQGLITQDIALLNPEVMLYSALLTPQGKYLYDFFITQHEDDIWMEGNNAQMHAMLPKLTLHQLRSDVSLSVEDCTVYVSFDQGEYADPRHGDMGWRSYQTPEGNETSPTAYHEKRIALAIPDGTTDLIQGKSSPFEGNLDRLNALSFTKGCYMGQELVSRIHHRGLIKKRLSPIDGQLVLTAQH